MREVAGGRECTGGELRVSPVPYPFHFVCSRGEFVAKAVGVGAVPAVSRPCFVSFLGAWLAARVVL